MTAPTYYSAAGARPVVRLLDLFSNRPDALRVRGPRQRALTDPPRLALDGLLVVGRSVWVSGCLACVAVRHCTLVPGWSLEHDCEPRSEEPGLVLDDLCCGRVDIRSSILGAIRVDADEVADGPVGISIADSIVDSTEREAGALAGSDGRRAHVAVTIRRTTVVGVVAVHTITLAENSIFDGEVHVARRQAGCMRFCWVPDDSRTPARYNCQPDLARRAVRESFASGDLTDAARDAALAREALRLAPQFASRRYGRPEYCQLDLACAAEIRRGADDEAELGAFHDLFAPQRETNLQARLDEYTPAGKQAVIIFVT